MTKPLSSLARLLAVLLAFSAAAPALAAGGGFGMSALLGAAGGAQASTTSDMPFPAYGFEIGGHINKGGVFVGAFGDRYAPSLWQAGFTGRQYLGSKQTLWLQIKVGLSGMIGMIGSDAESKTWTNYLNGGLGFGMQLPLGAKLTLQPFVEFDSFMPIVGTRRVSTGPNESELKFITGSRANVPMAGARLMFLF